MRTTIPYACLMLVAACRTAATVPPTPPPYRLPELPPRPEAPAPRAVVSERHPDIERAMAMRRGPEATAALALLEATRTAALERGDPRVAAWALHRHADHLTDFGRLEEAHREYAQALEAHLANDDPALAGRAANDLGLLTDHGSCSSATELAVSAAWYARAAELYALANDLHGRRLALNNEGRMHLWAQDFDRALDAWNEAAVLARRLGDFESERRVHANLALLWLVRAEGGFGGDPSVVVDQDAENMARAHFAHGAEAARLAGVSPRSVCEAWGDWEDRCDRVGATR